MRMERTVGPIMQDGCSLVKQERNGDAVISGNHKMPSCVEILSPINFDEASDSRMAKAESKPKMLPAC